MKYCQKCGKKMTDETMFCSGCGGAVSGIVVKKEKAFGGLTSLRREGDHLLICILNDKISNEPKNKEHQ